MPSVSFHLYPSCDIQARLSCAATQIAGTLANWVKVILKASAGEALVQC